VANPIRTGNGDLNPRNQAVGQGDGRFGSPRDNSRGYHTGVDIKAREGTPVYPAAPGRVIQSGDTKGPAGVMVIIEHANGSTSRYMHLQRDNLPKVGTPVTPDKPIGQVGRSGNVPPKAETHLHFEMRNKDGNPVAPNMTNGSPPKSSPDSSTNHRPPPPPGGPGAAPVNGVRIGVDVHPETFQRVKPNIKDSILKD
jgi:murein DD-endopeptidase MepM/ murein hydrolase activator NlpD